MVDLKSILKKEAEKAILKKAAGKILPMDGEKPKMGWKVKLAGILAIVASLRRIFMTLTAGDPFHPDNVARLRLIGLMLAALELGRYAFWALSVWLVPDLQKSEPPPSLTAWFSVLVVFVLAEVFREGARLRREAELTI